MAMRSSNPLASASRSSSGYPPIGTGTAAGRRTSDTTHLSCNRCRKSLSTTIFVCSCDCVFCEECTYSHFNSSSNCPICHRTLGSNDFVELVVADPSSASEESLKNAFQTLFTKMASDSNVISPQELCTRLLKTNDDYRRIMRFVLKQIVLENKTAGRQSGNLGRAFEDQKAEITNLKQTVNSQRIQMEQIVADNRHKVQALMGTVQELQKKVEEKDTQIVQFRQLISSSQGAVRIPGSSHSHGSGGGRIPMQPVHFNNASPSAPPMPGFVMQKQARERAKEEAIGAFARSRGPIQGAPTLKHMGGGLSEIDSVITPIQVPPPNHHLLRNQRHSSPHVVLPNTPRIRDLSAHSSYVFTSSSGRNPAAKRARYGGSSSMSPSGVAPLNPYGYSGRSGSGGRTPSYGSFGSR